MITRHPGRNGDGRRGAAAALTTLVLACALMPLSSTSALAEPVHEFLGEINESSIPSPPAPLANPFYPDGVAVDEATGPSEGDVYISDYFNGAVDEFSSTGAFLSQLTGFTNPEPVAIDNTKSLSSAGGLYIGDRGSGDIYHDEASNVCAAGLTGVTGVAVDQATGEIYAVTGESSKGLKSEENRVYRFNASCEALPSLEGPFKRPSSVAVDNTCYYAGLTGSACEAAYPSNGDLYVGDSGSEVIDKLDVSGKLLAQLQPGEVSGTGLAVDQTNGHVYAVSTSSGSTVAVVKELSATGALLSTIGESSPHYPQRPVEFGPRAVAVDRVTRDVYVSDTFNHVVDVFGPVVQTPEAFTGASSEVTAVGATLEGEVNPNGGDTTSLFEYGACGVSCSASDPYNFQQAASPPDDGNGTTNVAVSASIGGLLPNQGYHYRLLAKNNVAGSPPGGEREFATLAIAPRLETLPPQFVGFEAAVLSGNVDPEHGETVYYFEYGPCQTGSECESSEYASRTAPRRSSIYGVLSASSEIEGLQPSSHYHYRLIAEGEAGARGKKTKVVVAGANVELLTVPAPALLVTSTTASGVTQTAAVISGTLDPNGLQSVYGFQIGTQAGIYGPEVGTGRIPLGVYEPRTVTLALQGLQPGVTYHYRLLASNAFNATVYGADQTFTTAGAPAPFTQPLAPPLLAIPAIAFPAEAKPVTVRALTRSQKLANALRACNKKPKKQRAACKKQAHKQYGAVK